MRKLIMRRVFAGIALLLMSAAPALADAPNQIADTIEPEQAAVKDVIESYLYGSSYNDPVAIQSAFYHSADMYLDHKDHPIFKMTPAEYAALFEQRDHGAFNGRYGKITTIDVFGGIATAQAEILIPTGNSLYMDMFILKKLDGEWKIISKAAGRNDTERTGKSALILVQNTPRAASLMQIADAYEAAASAGNTVEFATADCAAVRFEDVNMSDAKQRAILYDQTIMFALGHPLCAETLAPSDYATAEVVYNHEGRMDPVFKSLFNEICSGDSRCGQ